MTFGGRDPGLLFNASVETDAETFDVELVTTLNRASDITGLGGNQSTLGDVLISMFGDQATDGALQETILNIAAIQDADVRLTCPAPARPMVLTRI